MTAGKKYARRSAGPSQLREVAYNEPDNFIQAGPRKS
jgi:hypothetical protein